MSNLAAYKREALGHTFILIESGNVTWRGSGKELVADNGGDAEIANAVFEMYAGERRSIAGGASGNVTLARLSDEGAS